EEPLCKCVARVAALAATRDPRFPPVTTKELADCTIEISVVSPLVRAAGLEDIEVGRDGLVVSSGYRRGLLLPQVAAEQGWTAQQFLERTCLKAGLPRSAWRRQGVTIQRFTATVFGEEELGLR
ncbi:MAG: AmmeMemoRadiSam system protein A, partial [Candidatus Brocadiae bacterium]|nr:AmmeMemoRadiSam system protein A [Candidatus Brocadiia bacterium]